MTARYFVADDGGDVDPRPLSGRVSSRCADGCAAFPSRPCHESEGYCYYGYGETYDGTWD